MRLFKEKTSINFLGRSRRNIAVGISVVLIAVSIGTLAIRGLDFGIDFTGGVLLEVGYSESANLPGIRSRLSDAGYDDYRVTRFGADTDVQVRLPPQIGVEPDAIRESLREILAADDPNVDLRRVEFVSAQVGDELTQTIELQPITSPRRLPALTLHKRISNRQPNGIAHLSQ